MYRQLLNTLLIVMQEEVEVPLEYRRGSLYRYYVISYDQLLIPELSLYANLENRL